jgi:hypothetical protein
MLLKLDRLQVPFSAKKLVEAQGGPGWQHESLALAQQPCPGQVADGALDRVSPRKGVAVGVELADVLQHRGLLRPVLFDGRADVVPVLHRLPR